MVGNRETDGETAARLERARIAEERLKKPGARKEARQDARWAAYDEINKQVEVQEHKMAAAGRAQLVAEGVLPPSVLTKDSGSGSASASPVPSPVPSPSTTPVTTNRQLPVATATAVPSKASSVPLSHAKSTQPTLAARPVATVATIGSSSTRAGPSSGGDDRDLRAAAIAARAKASKPKRNAKETSFKRANEMATSTSTAATTVATATATRPTVETKTVTPVAPRPSPPTAAATVTPPPPSEDDIDWSKVRVLMNQFEYHMTEIIR
jgi:hypothetical protein